jgi:serine protease Do
MHRFHRLALLLALAFLASGPFADGAVAEEVLHLGTGREIRGEVVKETGDVVFVDVGYTILSVPKKDIVRRETPDTDTAAPVAGGEQVVEGCLYRMGDSRECTVRENVENVGQAVTLIQTPSGLGSGFIITPDGYVVTNDHVVQGETEIDVTLFLQKEGAIERRKIEDVEIISLNAYADLALLKIEGEKDETFPYVRLAGEDAYRVGEAVFAIGNPMGLERTVSEGILSTLNRAFDGLTYLQTTAQINPGNSGGPLFNLRGEVIGVTNMKITWGEGLSFAIPVERLKWFLENRQAFAFDKDNPNTGYRYLDPPRKAAPPSGEDATGVEPAAGDGATASARTPAERAADAEGR